MAELCKNCSLPEPEFIEHPLWFGISFRAPISIQKTSRNVSNSELRQGKIIDLLAVHKKLTIKELNNLMPLLSQRTIQRDLQALKTKKKIGVSGQGTRFTKWTLLQD